MTEVVWGHRGESQGSLWELAAFEADLRVSGKSPSNKVFWTESGCLRSYYLQKPSSQRTLEARPRNQGGRQC